MLTLLLGRFILNGLPRKAPQATMPAAHREGLDHVVEPKIVE